MTGAPTENQLLNARILNREYFDNSETIDYAERINQKSKEHTQ